MTPALTRVTLGSVHGRLNVYLRFGKPTLIHPVSSCLRAAFFAPDDVFCRVWWERNQYGTNFWELAILQARAPRERARKIQGVAPGAAVLLRVRSTRSIKRMFRMIDAVERHGLVPSDVAPSYWRVVQNRLNGRREVGVYDRDRHGAAMRREMLRWAV